MKEFNLTDSFVEITNEIMRVYPIRISVYSKYSIEKQFDDKFKLNIFRIVQEQINNILKHAQAKRININIEDSNGVFLIAIAVDGMALTHRKKIGYRDHEY